MGNGCSVFKINKVCLDGDINIRMEKEEGQKKNDINENIINFSNKNNANSSVRKKVSISSNGIKFKKKQNLQGYEPHYSLASLPIKVNMEQNKENSKHENNDKNESIENNFNLSSNKLNNFTNFVQDLDISFKGSNQVEQNDVFNINYISLDTNYRLEIFNYINKIRTEPKSIINDIEDLLNKRQTIDNKIQIESEETHENVVFEDEGKALEETKEYLNTVRPISTNFKLNEELLIDIPEADKNELSLDKKITKILLNKRKNIIEKYPNCQFFINFIKDKKLGIFYLLSQNENISNFRNIIFNENFKEFNITWMKEKKKIFIAFLCFA